MSNEEEISHNSNQRTNVSGHEDPLLATHALQSNTNGNNPSKEDDALPKPDWGTEPNRVDRPLLSKTSLIPHKPQASTIDTGSLPEPGLVISTTSAIGDTTCTQQKRVSTDAVDDNSRPYVLDRPASPSIKHECSVLEALEEERRQAYVEDVHEDAVVPRIEKGTATIFGGLSISIEQEDLTDVTRSEHVKKARSLSQSTHSSHSSHRGSSIYGFVSEAVETNNEQERACENFEMDELGRPIFMWPLSSVGASNCGAPKNIAQESSRSPLPQSHDSEVPESQRHKEYSSKEAPISARASKRMLYQILDECHNQLQNSQILIASRLYCAVAEQDESNVTNTAELLKKNADLNPGDKINVALFQQKETIFVLATKLLQAFIPRGHSSIVADKYWGAVDSILGIGVGC